jgi:hypothetical protein
MAAEATAMASREGSAMMTAIAIATATVTMTTTTTTAMVTTATNNEDNKDKGGRYLVAGAQAQTTINMRCVEEESEHSRSKDVFLVGVVRFFVCGVLLTKEKVVCTTLCLTYVVEIRQKTPSISRFWGRVITLRLRETTETTIVR